MPGGGVRRDVTLNNATPDLQTVRMSFGDISGATSTSSFTYSRDIPPLQVTVSPIFGYNAGTVTKTENGSSITVNVSAAIKLEESNNAAVSRYPFTNQYIDISYLLNNTSIWTKQARSLTLGGTVYSGILSGNIDVYKSKVSNGTPYFIKTKVTKPCVVRITFAGSLYIFGSYFSLSKAKADMTGLTGTIDGKSNIVEVQGKAPYIEYTIDQNYPCLAIQYNNQGSPNDGWVDFNIVEISIRPVS